MIKKELHRKNNESCINVDFQSRSLVNEVKGFPKQIRESRINVKQIQCSVDKNETVYLGDKLHNLQVKILSRIIIAHLNINPIRNTFTYS